MLLIIFIMAMVLVPLLTGIVATTLFGQTKQPTVPALLFHSIPAQPSWALSSIGLEQFSTLIDALSVRSWKSLCVSEIAALRASSHALPPLVCSITFDDAYEDVYTNALPVLERHGHRGTIFVITAYIGKLADWDIYRAQRHMNTQQIRETVARGHEIGSHTLTHANLPYLSTAEVLRELRDSRAVLEDITGRAVTAVSFPFGSWNQRIWDCALKAGYTTATIYRGAGRAVDIPGIVPVTGVYRLDSADAVLCRLTNSNQCKGAHVRARILPHFAKGSAIWKYRRGYDCLRELVARHPD